MTTLFYFGGDGTANSRNRISSKFAIGNGTVHLYVGRVVTALNSHMHDIIKWPMPGTPEYRRTIEMHLLLHGLPNCLGFVDGSLVALFRKPTVARYADPLLFGDIRHYLALFWYYR
jgi:hypothetical protein